MENTQSELLYDLKRYVHHPIINIIITGNLPAIVTIIFNNLWEIIINGIKFKPLVLTPFDCFRQSITDTTGSEDEFVAIIFPNF